ncbi:MAG TPA: hypothetical protein VGR28_04645 [Candidatus Thermoplasmatota archaeon]|jgi:hypothetical protein|nr:hypothetical protein [Candidatus Thermoplasmatota archaeon]
MATATKSKEQWLAESRALEAWSDRVARDHPDWEIYWPGETRIELPWWRRRLKL